MNKIHKQRIVIIIVSSLGVTIAAALILYALNQNINVFVTPTQLSENKITSQYAIRLGGIVKPSSVKQAVNKLDTHFIVTDLKHDTTVHYLGVLPDLFREGKGVITEGKLNAEGILIADRVLAKHDENYMPKKVYESLRQNNGGQKL